MAATYEGWAPDPFDAHEVRYFVDGMPTKLVRDGSVEAFDDLPPIDLAPDPSGEPVSDPGPAEPITSEASQPVPATPDMPSGVEAVWQRVSPIQAPRPPPTAEHSVVAPPLPPPISRVAPATAASATATAAGRTAPPPPQRSEALLLLLLLHLSEGRIGHPRRSAGQRGRCAGSSPREAPAGRSRRRASSFGLDHTDTFVGGATRPPPVVPGDDWSPAGGGRRRRGPAASSPSPPAARAPRPRSSTRSTAPWPIGPPTSP